LFLAITDVSIVDVARGQTLGPRTVLVAAGHIVAIFEAGSPARDAIPASAARLDGRGRFLIPGLIDLHVHLFNGGARPPNAWALPLFVAHGVTAVREMATRPAALAQLARWRAAAARGTLVAPRILAAGVPLRAGTPAEAARQVDEAAAAGADFLKVFSDLSERSWRAALLAAHRRGLPVLGHVPAGVSLLAAAAAGQRGDEHLTQAFEACTVGEARWLEGRRGLSGEALIRRRDGDEALVLDAFDQAACERVAAALAAAPPVPVQVPTLILPFVEAQPARALDDDPRWRTLPPDERARWLRLLGGLTSSERALAARRWPIARRIAATFHRAGVPLLAGTDAPMPRVYPGSSLHEELELLVAVGLSPAEALRAATLAPAAFLGRAHDLGSIAPGKRADLVVLDADPLLDIRNTRRIHAVILDGRWLPRPAATR
jgi:imidazolonepropionase-like amidohydrolase